MSAEILFSPIRVAAMELKNRVVFAPTVSNMPDAGDSVGDRLLEYLAERARGGAGLVFTESAYVQRDGRSSYVTQLAIHEDRFIPGLRRLTDAIHAAGAKAACQIAHAGRQTKSAATGSQPVAPSAIPSPQFGEMPRELTVPEIEQLVESFAAAAARAVEAGFDAVEVHGAHGYLVGEFLSPYTNKRTDAYGGDLRSRARFPLEVLRRVRQSIGRDVALLYRMSADELVGGGLRLEDTQQVAPWLVEAGVDALDVSWGIFEMRHMLIPTMEVKPGAITHLAAGIKSVVDVPVITVGRINHPRLAEKILREGRADLIAFSRPLLADPELPRKAQEGREEDIRRCIACNQGCAGKLRTGEPITCIYNPDVGREVEHRLTPARTAKTVVVVGGGPGGLEAARVAALRGHAVTLFEQEQAPGGQLELQALAPFRGEYGAVSRYLARQARKAGVRMLLGRRADAEDVLALRPDAVVIATGSRAMLPDAPPDAAESLVSVNDALSGRQRVGARVLILGAGLAGLAAADYLSFHGHKVTLLELLDSVGLRRKPEWGNQVFLLERLRRREVPVITAGKLLGVFRGGVTALIEGHAETLGGYDTIISAIGAVPERGLADALAGKVADIHIVGDAREPRTALEAVHEGAAAGRRL